MFKQGDDDNQKFCRNHDYGDNDDTKNNNLVAQVSKREY